MGIKVTKKGKEIRDVIFNLFKQNPAYAFKDIYQQVKDKFPLSESTVRKHLANLLKDGFLDKFEINNKKLFILKNQIDKEFYYFPQKVHLEEAEIWVKDILPLVADQSPECRSILEYGFTEMFNNILSHAEASKIYVRVQINVIQTNIFIMDDGIGIFKRIKEKMNLPDERYSLIELYKGKLTTKPEDHTGEGIFFTSRACDLFSIYSDQLIFSHNKLNENDFLSEVPELGHHGTLVLLVVNKDTNKNLKSIFDEYSDPEDLSFNKTAFPVSVLRYKNEGIVSRSQAKRLLARFDKFKIIILDFEGIDFIGQAFADEIFRVFVLNHPDIKLHVVNTNEQIDNMIKHVKANI